MKVSKDGGSVQLQLLGDRILCAFAQSLSRALNFNVQPPFLLHNFDTVLVLRYQVRHYTTHHGQL